MPTSNPLHRPNSLASIANAKSHYFYIEFARKRFFLCDFWRTFALFFFKKYRVNIPLVAMTTATNSSGRLVYKVAVLVADIEVAPEQVQIACARATQQDP